MGSMTPWPVFTGEGYRGPRGVLWDWNYWGSKSYHRDPRLCGILVVCWTGIFLSLWSYPTWGCYRICRRQGGEAPTRICGLTALRDRYCWRGEDVSMQGSPGHYGVGCLWVVCCPQQCQHYLMPLWVTASLLPPCPFNTRYRPMDDSWERLASMTCGRSYFAAVALGGFIYALGGSSGDLYCTDTVECYDLSADTWR